MRGNPRWKLTAFPLNPFFLYFVIATDEPQVLQLIFPAADQWPPVIDLASRRRVCQTKAGKELAAHRARSMFSCSYD